MLSRLRLRVFAAVAAAGLVSAGAYPVSSVGAQWLLIWSLVILRVSRRLAVSLLTF